MDASVYGMSSHYVVKICRDNLENVRLKSCYLVLLLRLVVFSDSGAVKRSRRSDIISPSKQSRRSDIISPSKQSRRIVTARRRQSAGAVLATTPHTSSSSAQSNSQKGKVPTSDEKPKRESRSERHKKVSVWLITTQVNTCYQ